MGIFRAKLKNLPINHGNVVYLEVNLFIQTIYVCNVKLPEVALIMESNHDWTNLYTRRGITVDCCKHRGNNLYGNKWVNYDCGENIVIGGKPGTLISIIWWIDGTLMANFTVFPLAANRRVVKSPTRVTTIAEAALEFTIQGSAWLINNTMLQREQQSSLG